MKRNQLLALTLLGLVAVASAYGLSVVGNDAEMSERGEAVLLKDVPALVRDFTGCERQLTENQA